METLHYPSLDDVTAAEDRRSIQEEGGGYQAFRWPARTFAAFLRNIVLLHARHYDLERRTLYQANAAFESLLIRHGGLLQIRKTTWRIEPPKPRSDSEPGRREATEHEASIAAEIRVVRPVKPSWTNRQKSLARKMHVEKEGVEEGPMGMCRAIPMDKYCQSPRTFDLLQGSGPGDGPRSIEQYKGILLRKTSHISLVAPVRDLGR